MTVVSTRDAAYVPAAYVRTTILDSRSRHLVSRFTGGWSTSTREAVKAAGGIDAWFAKQLSPTAISDAFYLDSKTWWEANSLTPKQIWARDAAHVEGVWEANANYQRWSLLRRIYSQRQVLEQVAAFWEHHFHVPADGGPQGGHRNHYGRLIRSKALGRFDSLLNAVIVHPAMGIYLGNAESTKDNPNENLGRELLELHTVGRKAGYTEDDVKNSARILTGWRVDIWNSWDDFYDTPSHATGPVKVLGFKHANSSADGRAVTKAYLDYLAHHPSTARRIARKLAVRFVSDTPSDALVGHLASVYLANSTAIAPVLKALVASAEFKAAALKKTRTPEDDVIASYRALAVKVPRPTNGDSAANALLWQSGNIGQEPFTWPRPDGRPDTAEAWTSVSRILGSFGVHFGLAGGWLNGATFRTPAQWLPTPSIRFDLLVDHLSRSILGRSSTALLLQVASEATGITPSTVITKDHALVQWQMPRLLTVFLDNPNHIAR